MLIPSPEEVKHEQPRRCPPEGRGVAPRGSRHHARAADRGIRRTRSAEDRPASAAGAGSRRVARARDRRRPAAGGCGRAPRLLRAGRRLHLPPAADTGQRVLGPGGSGRRGDRAFPARRGGAGLDAVQCLRRVRRGAGRAVAAQALDPVLGRSGGAVRVRTDRAHRAGSAGAEARRDAAGSRRRRGRRQHGGAARAVCA